MHLGYVVDRGEVQVVGCVVTWLAVSLPDLTAQHFHIFRYRSVNNVCVGYLTSKLGFRDP